MTLPKKGPSGSAARLKARFGPPFRQALLALGAIIAILVLTVVALLVGVHDAPTLVAALNGLRDSLYALVQILVLLLLLAVLALLFGWASGKGDGAWTLVFENATGDTSYDGKAVSESLIAELHRIARLHKQGDLAGCPEDSMIGVAALHTSIPAEQLNLPTMRCKGEALDDSITDVGTISMGDSQVPVGRLLLSLKSLWPTGRRSSVLTGSIQKFDQVIRLVARTNASDGAFAWEVSGALAAHEGLPGLIRDLAYQIVYELSAPITAKTWLTLKYFTEARASYDRYCQTRHVDDLDATRAACLAALAAEPDFWPLYRVFDYLGAGYLRLGQFESAEAMLQAGFELEQRGADLLPALTAAEAAWLVKLRLETPNLLAKIPEPDFDFSTILIPAEAGRMQQFQSDHRKLLSDLKEDWVKLLYGLGWAQWQQKKFEAAAATYRRVLTFDPGDSDASVRLAVSEMRLGRRVAAERAVLAAIERKPQAPNLWSNLAWVYMAFGQLEPAIEAHRRWIAQQPDSALAWGDLALLHMDFGRMPEALEAAQQAIRVNPKDPLVYIILAYVYWNFGRADEAMPQIRRAIALGPNLFVAHAVLAAYCQQFGPPGEYQAQVARARELIDGAEDYARACFEVVCGHPDAALPLLKQQLLELQISPERVRVDPTLKPIQNDPRFKAMVADAVVKYRTPVPG